MRIHKHHLSQAHKTPKEKEEEEDKEAAESTKNAELEEMKEKGAKAEAERKYQERLENVNPYDGLLHNPDGSREFPEGGVVGGVNNYLKVHHHRRYAPVSADAFAEMPKREPHKAWKHKN